MLKTDLRKNTPRAASFPDVSLAAKVVGAQGRKGRGKDARSLACSSPVSRASSSPPSPALRLNRSAWGGGRTRCENSMENDIFSGVDPGMYCRPYQVLTPSAWMTSTGGASFFGVGGMLPWQYFSRYNLFKRHFQHSWHSKSVYESGIYLTR